MPDSNAKQQATQVTLIGMALDLFLVVIKIIGGIYTQSFALITDGIHSLTDAITDIFVIIVARIAHEDPDENHPYGHGRFETLGTISMGLVLVATAAVLFYDAYQRLQASDELPIPAAGGMLIALISIAGKEWIFQYTMRVARRLNSNLLRANAWHSRSDAISSVAVLIGILAAQQGYIWMDTVAGAFVALIIAKVGWELCTDSLKELVDTSIPAKRRAQIEESILQIAGVNGIPGLRTRLSGGKVILDLCILVDPRISVSEGHQIAELVSRTLTGNFSDVSDVLVHVDPLPPESEKSTSQALDDFPERPEIIASIREAWNGLIDDHAIESISLHFLEQGIEVELTLHEGSLGQAEAERLANALQRLSYIQKLRIYSKTHDFRVGLAVS